ncbi:MAG: GIDE domain-containing protein [Candidatus Sulfotelmatobacter sp.]|jgi:E3 ubiquitin ligase
MARTLIPLHLIVISLVLNSSEPIRAVLWCVVGICIGIYLFIQGFRLLQRRHLILNTPVSRIRSASLGPVEFSGLAVGPYTVVAPITERACYYFRTVAWEWKREGRSNRWVKVAAECMHVPFFLDDNTGKVMVDPRGAELDLHRDFQQEFCDGLFTLKQEAPPNVHSFLSRHGVSTTNKIKVEEFCIKPKNSLFLFGTLDENPGLELTAQPIQDEEHNTLTFGKSLWSTGGRLGISSSSFVTDAASELEDRSLSERLIGVGGGSHEPSPAQSARIIRLSPESGATKVADMTQQQKIAAALLKAGISNPAAWQTAGVTPTAVADDGGTNGSANISMPTASSQSSAQSTAAPDGFDSHPPVVLMKGRNNPAFMISWRSQRDLARSMGWKCTLMIWGGAALSLFCLYGVLYLTHSL